MLATPQIQQTRRRTLQDERTLLFRLTHLILTTSCDSEWPNGFWSASGFAPPVEQENPRLSLAGGLNMFPVSRAPQSERNLLMLAYLPPPSLRTADVFRSSLLSLRKLSEGEKRRPEIRLRFAGYPPSKAPAHIGYFHLLNSWLYSLNGFDNYISYRDREKQQYKKIHIPCLTRFIVFIKVWNRRPLLMFAYSESNISRRAV